MSIVFCAATVALTAFVDEFADAEEAREEEFGPKSAFPMGRIVPFIAPVMNPPLIIAEETVPSVLWSSEISMNED